MSGWIPEKGIFELTLTKAMYWFRVDVPENFKSKHKKGSLYYIRDWLIYEGMEVDTITNNFLSVHALPGKIWECLSGIPSDPNRENYYLGK